MERVILHSDLNNFYASVECLYRPEIRGYPVAVAGDPEQRHGIVLAKNQQAKRAGVKTGMPLWMARQHCKDILFVPPHYDRYLNYSKQAKEIYGEYTSQVEPFGLDECWLDITHSMQHRGDGKGVADEIRRRMRDELGITASVGVSFNKIFAKLGSDMKKPDATTVIRQEDVKDKVWPLPVGDLLYVGKATEGKLAGLGVHTIGDLAVLPPEVMQSKFGKVGAMLWMFANGRDTSPVLAEDEGPPIKTVGNSTTTPRDLVTDEDVKITLMILAESVAERLRDNSWHAGSVQITIRDKHLFSYQRQTTLRQPTCSAQILFEEAFALFVQNRPRDSIRSLGLRGSNLVHPQGIQTSLYSEDKRAERQQAVEQAMDGIRRRFGHFAIQRGVMLADRQLSDLDPKGEHVIYPVGFLKAT